jgi:hypothetical protein
VKNSTGTTDQVGARVTFRQGDSGTGCTPNQLMANTVTDSAGTAAAVLPMGTYRLCVSTVSGGNQRLRQSGVSGQPAHPILRPPSSLSPATVNFFLPNSSSAGSGCSQAAVASP